MSTRGPPHPEQLTRGETLDDSASGQQQTKRPLERFPLNLNREIIGVPSGVQIRFGSSDDNGGGCAMAKGYSKELRERVVAIIEEGDSAREAARLLNVGASTAIRWIERWT